jgi:hypothetical protein
VGKHGPSHSDGLCAISADCHHGLHADGVDRRLTPCRGAIFICTKFGEEPDGYEIPCQCACHPVFVGVD